MTKTMKMRLLPALLGAAFSTTAGASGFQLLEQDASGIGNAFAGSAAVAEGAGTIFYNPAGMTQLQTQQVSVGATYISPSYKFSNKSSSSGVLTGDNVDGGQAGTVPNAYISAPMGNNFYAGIGVGAPFGLSTSYPTNWIGGAQSLLFDIRTRNINPSLAWKMNDTISLGVGVDFQRIEAKYKRQGAIGGGGENVRVNLNVSDDAVGWNVGALAVVDANTKVGFSYRANVEYTATGDLDVSNLPMPLAASAKIKLPDTYILSGTRKVNDDCELLADISYTGWSSIPKVDIVAAGSVQQSLETDFKDTWRVAFGMNHRMSETMKLKTGIAYDQTPVKNANTRLVSLPDNDRIWLSVGGQWKLTPASTVDLGAAYLLLQDAKIHNDQSPTRGVVDGTYKDSAWMLGAQYSASF